MKILYFGSSPHSARLLMHLVESPRYDVIGVITQPSDNEVVKLNQDLNLTIFRPDKLDETAVTKIKEQLSRPNLIIVLDYGLLIPVSVIEWPRQGAINIHFSLLPEYRGANPVPWAILDGKTKTGVSFVSLSEKFDCGAIIAQKVVLIDPTDTGQSLSHKCFAATLEIFDSVITAWTVKTIKTRSLQMPLPQPKTYQLCLPPKPQPATSPTRIARRLTREDGHIDWSKSAQYLERQVQAFHPWPGTWTTLGELIRNTVGPELKIAPTLVGKRVKILRAQLRHHSRLQIDQLQIEGKKPISWPDFLSGYTKRRLT